MAMKRPAGFAKAGRPKKVKQVDHVGPVVRAISEAEVLDAGCRNLLAVVLPMALETPKADRHPYEVEVVTSAESCLSTIEVDIAAKHKAALEKQNTMISLAEMQKRQAAKAEAEAKVKEAKTACEGKVGIKQQCAGTVHEAQSAVKLAEKEAAKAETELRSTSGKKKVLDDAALADMQCLRDEGSSSAAGGAALKALLSLGKNYKFDTTLLQSFPLACKKSPGDRTDFDNTMFSAFQSALNEQRDKLSQTAVELEQEQTRKLAAVESAKKVLTEAEEKLASASDEAKSAQAAVKSAQTVEKEATASLSSIWPEMKEACDAADQLAKDITAFKEEILGSFGTCKEKVAEPEVEEEDVEAGEDDKAEEPTEETTAPPEPVAETVEASASAE
jgi:hypothetical protein